MAITLDIAELHKQLTEIGNELVAQLRSDLELKKVNASKKYSNSLKSEVEISAPLAFIDIQGEAYFKYIEKGSKPTIGGNPSWKNAPSDIKKWIQDKGITYEKGMEYAILKSIFKKGTAMYQGKGRYTKPISEPFEPENIAKIVNKYLEVNKILIFDGTKNEN